MQLWFISAFTVGVIRLQTVLTLSVVFEWEEVFVFIELLFTLVIALLAWIHNGDRDEIKASEAVRISSKVKSGSIQDEKTPLISMKKYDATEIQGERFPASPEEDAGVVSRALFLWTNSLYKLGLTHALQERDLWPLIPEDKSDAVSAAFRCGVGPRNC